MSSANWRKVEHLPGAHRSSESSLAWHWDRYLIGLTTSKTDDLLMKNKAVPVSSFREHALRSHLEHVDDKLMVELEVRDYKKILDQPIKVYWPAHVLKIAGYRALLRWAGATDADIKRDFWVNLGSSDIHGVALRERETKDVYLPPHFLEQRWTATPDFRTEMMAALQACANHRSFSELFEEDKRNMYTVSKLRVGQRLELLDCNRSSRVRPARIKHVVGRRIAVQVLKQDCEQDDEDDRQYGTTASFWVDQSSFYLFHVGWAVLNGYGIEAKKDYINHSTKVAAALRRGETPPYEPLDVTREHLQEWKETSNAKEKWEKGMKFELMDPLAATIKDLYPASVLEVLHDGYLKVAVDGPEAEDECIPLHCTSPLMFSVGYAEKTGIDLKGPEENPNFKWAEYLKETGAKAAPESFFRADPEPSRKEGFKEGARLEASDLCENVLICPATVKGVKGRLVHVHFDGWEDTFDQYFDIDSNDIFPIGWCELHGYKLEAPQDEIELEDPKGKKKK